MQKQLTDEQIAQARALRGEGKSYAEIRDAIGADVEPDTIRAHCGDVAIAGKLRTRTAKGVSVGKDGRTIVPFTDPEDDAIIAWSRSGGKDAAGNDQTMANLAADLGRKRHSVAARIQTLKKHGKL